MRGALDAGGYSCGVLADSLEKTAMNREHRNLLLDGQLVLISPYDPSAGFNVGNAMQRNKLIYALADAALVVSSDLNKGGTWSGATEQLNKLHFVPIYVRSTGQSSPGLDALRAKGAKPWPNPTCADELGPIFDVDAEASRATEQDEMSLFKAVQKPESEDLITQEECPKEPPPLIHVESEPETAEQIADPTEESEQPQAALDADTVQSEPETTGTNELPLPINPMSPADALLEAVRELLRHLLATPMKDNEVAAALDVSNAQAKVWLQRLVEEGFIEKQKKPAGYVIKQARLFD